MTEHVLVWHPKVPGDAPATATTDDQLRLIGMPTGLVRPARQALAADQLTPAAREIMDAIVADLHARAAAPDRPVTRFSLNELDEAGRAAVADILGEGDVWAKVGVGDRGPAGLVEPGEAEALHRKVGRGGALAQVRDDGVHDLARLGRQPVGREHLPGGAHEAGGHADQAQLVGAAGHRRGGVARDFRMPDEHVFGHALPPMPDP